MYLEKAKLTINNLGRRREYMLAIGTSSTTSQAP